MVLMLQLLRLELYYYLSYALQQNPGLTVASLKLEYEVISHVGSTQAQESTSTNRRLSVSQCYKVVSKQKDITKEKQNVLQELLSYAYIN